MPVVRPVGDLPGCSQRINPPARAVKVCPHGKSRYQAKARYNVLPALAVTLGLPPTLRTWQEISTALAENRRRMWGSNPDAL